MMPTAVVEGTSTGVRAETSSKQIGSRQVLLKGVGFTMMDSDRHLYCLSLKPTLKFVAMSSSSFSLQAIGGISTPVFGSVLATEEDENEEKDEVDGEDGDANEGVLVL